MCVLLYLLFIFIFYSLFYFSIKSRFDNDAAHIFTFILKKLILLRYINIFFNFMFYLHFCALSVQTLKDSKNYIIVIFY